MELGEAQQELRAFIEKAGMPAGCTLLGLSALPTDHPLNKGMLGMHGNLGPNINTNKCDVLIAVGMRFDDRVTGKLETYAKQAKIIHFDIDPAEIDKNVKPMLLFWAIAKRHWLPLPNCWNPPTIRNGLTVSGNTRKWKRKGNPSGITSGRKSAKHG